MQTVRVDEDDDVQAVSRARRERRQEAARRAIHQETEEIGLRRRREQQAELAAVTNQNQPPVVQVNVGEAWNSGIVPPLPRFASAGSDLESRPTQVLSGNSGFPSSCSMPPRGSALPNHTQDSVSPGPRSSMPLGFNPPRRVMIPLDFKGIKTLLSQEHRPLPFGRVKDLLARKSGHKLIFLVDSRILRCERSR